MDSKLVSLNLSGRRVGTRPYARFVNQLHLALVPANRDEFALLLDGLAGQKCLELVRPKSVRRLGAFFTPSNIAESLVGRLEVRNWSDAIVFDPACGAADLLIPVAKRLPLKRTASATLEFWNERIFGCDISQEFIEAARLRLALLAIKRGSRLDKTLSGLAELLSNLVVADGLLVSEQYSTSSHIIMNPPYGKVVGRTKVWRDGLVNTAAVFMERAALLAAPGAQIVALLPEVLRTGSSYERWRVYISRFVLQGRPHSMGLFSDYADVDVFMQQFTRRENEASATVLRRRPLGDTVGDHFSVHVGPVVPHRHPQAGPKFAYLHSRNATPWAEICRLSEVRRFDGKTFKPPFVVVRRTSRPGDYSRATASLVLGKRKVAVENHLIVILPKRGGISICRSLVQLLGSQKADAHLNKVMRCRHLTTASVASVPWL